MFPGLTFLCPYAGRTRVRRGPVLGLLAAAVFAASGPASATETIILGDPFGGCAPACRPSPILDQSYIDGAAQGCEPPPGPPGGLLAFETEFRDCLGVNYRIDGSVHSTAIDALVVGAPSRKAAIAAALENAGLDPALASHVSVTKGAPVTTTEVCTEVVVGALPGGIVVIGDPLDIGNFTVVCGTVTVTTVERTDELREVPLTLSLAPVPALPAAALAALAAALLATGGLAFRRMGRNRT